MSKSDKPIDWKGIESDYAAGRMSVREIARWYGLSEAAIRKKAKQAGWVRSANPGHIERSAIVKVDIPPLPNDPHDLVGKARALAGRMMEELDTMTSRQDELEAIIFEEESDPRRRQALMKVISLSERAKTLKDISATLKTVNEASAPEGKKAQRQANAEQIAQQGRFQPRSGPRLAVIK
ncbi:hypothetical protein GCM10011385_00190 [Nitratireductor aestuarii]|uniref:Uncharacterized protein n=1 Tax=Nitratireductor aestuarii TaxID=1735103 RepID=A0A916RCH4_9HYPH|nr:hypothetical protein [Nitratireductor aestuarii]GGA50915.1 hypothetical protein GCM10011385_00190 [Nitratireductor aestuarii]